MSFFVATTHTAVSRSLAARIDKAVKAIDPSMSFERYSAPGNPVKGWLERPNDGTNDYNYRREDNRKCAEIMESMIAAATQKKGGAK